MIFGFLVSLAPHIGGIFANKTKPPSDCEMVNIMGNWLSVTSVIYIVLIVLVSFTYLVERDRCGGISYVLCCVFVIFTACSLLCGAVITEMAIRMCDIWKELVLATVFVLSIPSIQSFLVCVIVFDCKCGGGGRSGYEMLDD